MSHKSSKFFWVILMVCSSMTTVLSVNIAYPDSYEMYSYKQPRTMSDLKHQHMRQAMIDVTETINEVQKILQKDPKLPRLTRGEIEDLFEMVTREEYKRSLAAGDYQRAKHMRSLMLVLPFNTNNYSEERLEELFTRMPVTKMVDTMPRQRIMIPATQKTTMADMMGAPSLVLNQQQIPTTFKPNYATNMKTMYTAGVTTYHPKNVQMVTTLYPTNLPPQAPMGGQPMMITNYYPRSTMQAMSPFHAKSGAAQMTTVYNPKMIYHDPSVSPYHPSKTTAQTIYYPKATLQSVANAIPTGYISQFHPRMETTIISHKSAPDSLDASTSQIPYMTMALQKNYNKRFTLPTTDETVRMVTPTLRPNVKTLLATIGLEPDSNALEINNEMSEMEQSSSTKVEVARKTTTTTESTPTTAPTVTTKKPKLTPELKELLQSFGLLSNEEPSAQIDGPIQDEAPSASPSSLKDESLSVTEFKPLPKSVTASDIEEKIDSSFEIKPDDFSSFKPLPIKETAPAKDEELENLLKSFGILKGNNPSKSLDSDNSNDFDSQEGESEAIEVTEKVPAMSRVPDVDVGFLSPDLTKVLGNIGVNNVHKNQVKSTASKSTRRLDKQQTTTTTTDQESSSTLGTVASSTMQNDYQKLHLLLDTIKELDNLTANLTDEELEKLNLRNFNLSQDVLTESTGPDPTYDSDANAVKNEVKREINSSEPTRIQLDITGTTATRASDDLSLDDDDDDDDNNDGKTDDAKATTATSSSSSSSSTTSTTTTESSERKAKQDSLDSEDAGSEKETEKDTAKDDDTTTPSTTTTTEESKSANIGELAASFGGNDGLDPVSEEPLPPPRKNGFYFFADWNSFLEVGLDDSDKVEVKFEPKVGDQTQFVPVKIP